MNRRTICEHSAWSDECMDCEDAARALSPDPLYLDDARRTHIEFSHGVPKVHRAPVRDEPAKHCAECHTRCVAVEVSYLDCQVSPPVPIAALFCGSCVHVETLAFKGYVKCLEKRLTWLHTNVFSPDDGICSVCGHYKYFCAASCVFP